jgi:hypothetical protein
VGHTVLKAGNKLPLKGVTVQVLAAGGKFIQRPVTNGYGAGAPNPLCAANQQAAVIERDVEDNLSIGLLITLGKFRMLDLADLESNHNRSLVCPNNLIGTVDVYHVNVHGQFKGITPELIGAVHPRVAIMGNGAKKGRSGHLANPSRNPRAGGHLASALFGIGNERDQAAGRFHRKFRAAGRRQADQVVGAARRFVHHHQQPQRF